MNAIVAKRHGLDHELAQGVPSIVHGYGEWQRQFSNICNKAAKDHFVPNAALFVQSHVHNYHGLDANCWGSSKDQLILLTV